MAEFKGAYSGCEWCGGNGCLQCPEERKKAEQRAMEPIFTADRNNPDDMALLNEFCGREALGKAFGPDGEGMVEVERNAAIASFKQAVRKMSFESKEATQ